MSEVREGICVCGGTFEIPIKRGRPPVRCPECREAYSDGTLPDRLASKGIDPHVALRRRFNSDPSLDPQDPLILAEREAETDKAKKKREAEALVDRLEANLKMAGQHISQHRDKW